MGRPTKYKKEYATQAAKLCKLGATDKDLADFFEVDVATIGNWKHDHPVFFESIKESKELADARVERALFERAIGYTHKDTKFATFEGEITDEREYDKHIPPDATSMIFWLKNRQPKKWRDKQEHEHSGKVEFTPVISPHEDDPE